MDERIECVMVETVEVQDRPENLLAHVASLRTRAHARVRGAWLPLLVFGVVTLSTIPLYARTFYYPHANQGGSFSTKVPFFAGLPGARSQRQAWLFWLIAAPLGYLVCALWYHRRAQRQGLAPQWRRYVGVGLGLFAMVAALRLAVVHSLVLSAHNIHLLPADDQLFGVGAGAVFSPLIAVSLGLLVLAWVERSWLVGVVAVIFGGLVLIINTYNYGNIPTISGHISYRPYFRAPAHNIIVLASVLLLGAAGTGVSAWRARRSA